MRFSSRIPERARKAVIASVGKTYRDASKRRADEIVASGISFDFAAMRITAKTAQRRGKR